MFGQASSTIAELERVRAERQAVEAEIRKLRSGGPGRTMLPGVPRAQPKAPPAPLPPPVPTWRRYLPAILLGSVGVGAFMWWRKRK